MSNKKLHIIGIHELINIPKHELENIPTKTDTGAYNSAIDCSFVEEKENDQGEAILSFILFHSKSKYYTGKKYNTKRYKVKTVRSSNGIETNRYQIKLRIELKGKSYRTTFNLSSRSKMRYPVLLGRKFLANRFLVDVSKGRKLKKSKA